MSSDYKIKISEPCAVELRRQAETAGLTINTPGKYILIATDISEGSDLRVPADPVMSIVFTLI